ncbi:MAG TPA: BrnA antitoxin family protein [Candidatus Saccharimonadales bacterium]|nr:BrnA antitoxin family protein [Candidatus Saccharimonadales bacterium]
MNKIKNQIPKFRNEDEEREFWATHSVADYMDSYQAVEFDLSELKPSTKTISLRLPESLIDQLKKLANKRDVPYQSLLKIFLSEKIKEENMHTA